MSISSLLVPAITTVLDVFFPAADVTTFITDLGALGWTTASEIEGLIESFAATLGVSISADDVAAAAGTIAMILAM